jgi:hypothetical protein
MTETTSLEHSDGTDSSNASPKPTERDALGRLFQRSQRLRQADHYRAFLDFIARLSHYSPFNSALLHVQRPEAMYFATESQWQGRFGRHVKTGARPCVILQPFGPILFVFAAEDTEPGDDGTSLPERVTEPFAVDGTLGLATWRRAAAHCEDKERVRSSTRSGLRTGLDLLLRTGDALMPPAATHTSPGFAAQIQPHLTEALTRTDLIKETLTERALATTRSTERAFAEGASHRE